MQCGGIRRFAAALGGGASVVAAAFATALVVAGSLAPPLVIAAPVATKLAQGPRPAEAQRSDAQVPSADASGNAQLIGKGAALVAIGGCEDCHTAPGGKAFAGGRALHTPFGVVYGTNITPDPGTGIGRWTRADFDRAMREGVDARGRDLYPVFPYDHFRALHDDDLDALWAYLRSLEPVAARPPRNELRFPYNVRAFIRTWKALYLRDPVVPRDASRGAAWNRGAYLVAGLGHCGACHTPRNALGAEERSRELQGGDAEGWHAPGLLAASPSPVPWDPTAMSQYLRTGIAPRHSIAGGPMAGVTRALAHADEDDVRAMATYLASASPAPRAPGEGASNGTTADNADDASDAATNAAAGTTASPSTAVSRGQSVYAQACASCHEAGRRAWPEGALGPRNWIAATIPTPRNLIQIVLHGIHPQPGEQGRWMPAFAGSITPAQLADLAAYVRERGGRAPWRDIDATVRDVIARPEG